jgi:two-component system phosphate regulon response regulator OmpR
MDNEQLLVVDDDEALRELLRDYLSREGFRVATVANGEEMDRWLAEQQADLVILDLMLPGEDGLSLARRLRAGVTCRLLCCRPAARRWIGSSAWK